jgi:outer membrane biosynthesis protein TonB
VSIVSTTLLFTPAAGKPHRRHLEAQKSVAKKSSAIADDAAKSVSADSEVKTADESSKDEAKRGMQEVVKVDKKDDDKKSESKKDDDAKKDDDKVVDKKDDEKKSEAKEEVKEKPKEEVKEKPKEEVKEKPKEEVKEKPKEEVKEEVDDGTATCRSIGFFTGENTIKPRKVIPNTSGICQYLEDSCCTTDDFKSLKEWWEGIPGSKKSRQKKRLSQAQDIALFTNSLIKLHGELTTVATWLLEKSNLPDNSYCKSKSKVIETHQANKMSSYLDDFEECSEFIMKLQPSILCSACDPKMQNS